MSYLDEESPLSEKKMLAVFIPMFLIVIWKITPLSDYFWEQTMTPEKIEMEFLHDPSAGEAMLVFKENYPSDFSVMVNDVERTIKAGADSREIGMVGFQFIRNWMQTKTGAIAQAPAEQMGVLADANLALVKDLKDTSVTACAQFSNNGLQPGTQLSPAQRMQATNITKYTILAVKAGETNPVNRDIGQGNASSLGLFQTEMQNQTLSETQLMALQSGEAYDSPSDMCAVGHAIYASIANLPLEDKANMMAMIMASSPANQ